MTAYDQHDRRIIPVTTTLLRKWLLVACPAGPDVVDDPPDDEGRSGGEQNSSELDHQSSFVAG